MAYQSPRTPIGERRHRITVRLAQTSDDGMGGTVSSTDVFRRQQMWAKVETIPQLWDWDEIGREVETEQALKKG